MPKPVLTPTDKKQIREVVATVESIHANNANDPSLRATSPRLIINALTRSMLAPMVKFLSSNGSVSGLHKSVVAKMTKKEMVAYIMKLLPRSLLTKTLIGFIWVSAYLLVQFGPFLTTKNGLRMLRNATIATVALTYLIDIIIVSLKRRASQNFATNSQKTYIDRENVRVKKSVEGRSEFVPTRTEKVSIRALRAVFAVSAASGGVAGVAVLIKKWACVIVTQYDNRSRCTCETVTSSINQRVDHLRDIINETARKIVQRQIMVLRVALKLMPCEKLRLQTQREVCRAFEEIAGLEKGSCATMTCAELRTAYRRAAARLHPDKKGGSNEAFGKLKEEYGSLGCSESPEEPTNLRLGYV